VPKLSPSFADATEKSSAKKFVGDLGGGDA